MATFWRHRNFSVWRESITTTPMRTCVAETIIMEKIHISELQLQLLVAWCRGEGDEVQKCVEVCTIDHWRWPQATSSTVPRSSGVQGRWWPPSSRRTWPDPEQDESLGTACGFLPQRQTGFWRCSPLWLAGCQQCVTQLLAWGNTVRHKSTKRIIYRIAYNLVCPRIKISN